MSCGGKRSVLGSSLPCTIAVGPGAELQCVLGVLLIASLFHPKNHRDRLQEGESTLLCATSRGRPSWVDHVHGPRLCRDWPQAGLHCTSTEHSIHPPCFSTLDAKKNDCCHPGARCLGWITKDHKWRKQPARILKEQSLWGRAVSCKLHPIKPNSQRPKPQLTQEHFPQGPELYLLG